MGIIKNILKIENEAAEELTLPTGGSGTLATTAYADSAYSHPTTAGNKHIPTGGASSQLLTYSSSGTVVWTDALTLDSSQNATFAGNVTLSSGTLTAANADFNGDLDIDGTTNLDVVDIDGAVDMASTLTLAGNADFNGDLDVDGTTNLDVVDIDGAVDMASTLAVGGTLTGTHAVFDDNNPTLKLTNDNDNYYVWQNLDSNNDLSLNYNTTLLYGYDSSATSWDLRGAWNFASTATVTGAFIANGGSIFNEGSADVDFRVESNGNANMLFVDGGADRVGIGIESPNANLHIGSSTAVGNQSNPALQIGDSSNYRLGFYTTSQGAYIENKNGDDGINFKVKTLGQAMRIAAVTGNVGIGDASPSHKLTVAGGIVETGGVLKENLLTNSGFDVWSNSTLLEATGGAAPVTVGAESALTNNLVTNGGMDSATTGWAVAAWSGGGEGSLFNTSGGATGNALLVDSTTNRAFAYQEVTVVVGKLYKFSCWGKQVSGGNGSVSLATSNGGSQILSPTRITTSEGAYFSFIFEATATSFWINFSSDINESNFLVDTVCLYEVTPGCVASNTLAMDGWYKTASADIWRQHNDGGTLTKDGSFYSLKILSGAADNLVAWKTTTTRSDSVHVQRFAGRTVTFGCWVQTDEASHIRLMIDHSSQNTSDYHTGTDDTWEWLEVTGTVGASATQFWCRIENALDAKVAYIAQPMLVFGSSIGEGNYTRPQGEVVNLEKSVTVGTNAALAAADDKVLNLEALTDGKIPKGAKAVNLNVVTKNTDITDYQGVSYGPTSGWDRAGSLQCLPLVNSLYQTASGVVNCDSNGDIYQTVSEAGATISYNGIAVTQVHLR